MTRPSAVIPGSVVLKMYRWLMSSLIIAMLLQTTVEAGTLFSTYAGYRLDTCSLHLSSSPYGTTLSRCVASCSQTTGCVSGSYLQSSGQCCLSDQYIYQQGVTFTTESDSVYFQVKQEYASDGQWLVAFRAKSHNGQTAYSYWYDMGTYNDSPLGSATTPITCWSTSPSAPCDHHLRSRLLDLWNDNIVIPTRVKYSMYENGVEVVNVIFNGTGSTPTSWFSPSRILSSSIAQITPSFQYNFFSIKGYLLNFPTFSVVRRFYISHFHDDCPGDTGFMAVVELGGCDWELQETIPIFFYSPLNTAIALSNQDVGKADVMAVFVEL